MEILPPAESIAVLLSKTLERYSNSPFPDLNKLAGIELWTTPNPTVAFLARMSHLLPTRRMEEEEIDRTGPSQFVQDGSHARGDNAQM
jgi:hypothetical protein